MLRKVSGFLPVFFPSRVPGNGRKTNFICRQRYFPHWLLEESRKMPSGAKGDSCCLSAGGRGVLHHQSDHCGLSCSDACQGRGVTSPEDGVFCASPPAYWPGPSGRPVCAVVPSTGRTMSFNKSVSVKSSRFRDADCSRSQHSRPLRFPVFCFHPPSPSCLTCETVKSSEG